MIVVDSSVWIDHFNGRQTGQVHALHRLLHDEDVPILVGDIIMYEVLCGFRSAHGTIEVKQWLERLLLVSMLGYELVYRAVGHFQGLRAKGVTVGAIDMMIGSYCIVTGASLLTADRAFAAMRDHLGLRLVA